MLIFAHWKVCSIRVVDLLVKLQNRFILGLPLCFSKVVFASCTKRTFHFSVISVVVFSN